MSTKVTTNEGEKDLIKVIQENSTGGSGGVDPVTETDYSDLQTVSKKIIGGINELFTQASETATARTAIRTALSGKNIDTVSDSFNDIISGINTYVPLTGGQLLERQMTLDALTGVITDVPFIPKWISWENGSPFIINGNTGVAFWGSSFVDLAQFDKGNVVFANILDDTMADGHTFFAQPFSSDSILYPFEVSAKKANGNYDVTFRFLTPTNEILQSGLIVTSVSGFNPKFRMLG